MVFSFFFFCHGWRSMSKLTLSGWEEKNEDAAPGGNVIRDRLTSTRTPGRLISPSPLASLSVGYGNNVCQQQLCFLCWLLTLWQKRICSPFMGSQAHNELNKPEGAPPGATRLYTEPGLCLKSEASGLGSCARAERS